ncbi:hypothetical protein CBR_g4011 [Chara braunii]|uniref:Reverse transcriptase n=1 Tax=Chara braunii TaxID=69332 RepID=A0A388KGZ3_CHABU|nr:hypothetical protein CBR_g4011 [Chara braunii]|eukprot:GBG69312.1 hypothetical protein CBR_g4011 [Chara braunii]
MDLLRYDPLCPEVELISLEPDPPDPSSIFAALISTSTPQPADTPSTSQVPTPSTAESTHTSCADADVEELMRFTADLEPVIRDLIREYRDVFPPYFSYSGIPLMRSVEHSIKLVPDYRVHHQAPYRLSIPEVTELKRQLEELLRLGFIKPSNSPWGARVLFARKADGTLRLCIDYRGLNRYTVKNRYPMPRADELFDRLAGNRFFTKIDLRSGYHQILVAAEDQPKTAFRSRFGHYDFTVMPFGLTNAPATFQTATNDIFRDILEKYVLVYLDDILVYSRTLEDHIRHLRDVLQRLRKHGFYAKLSKCRFAQRKVDFLGHHVSDQGLHMDDAKIIVIAEWPVPTSAKQLRSFLGLTSYYSNFIQGYASYPMPRSDELFDRLAGNRFVTKIDLRRGYHQIHVAAADQPKTAFRLRFSHYEFTVMPFGLTNAPTTFQWAINDIFKDILEQYVLVYIDDILVYSRTLEEYLRHLRDILDRLRRHGFYAKLSKCRFAQHKVDFLGQYVSNQGLHMDDVNITAIAEWPVPTSAKQLRSFLGLTSYYSNFIQGYASAREVADIVFDQVVRDHDFPLSIIYDCDPRFTSRFWRRLHKVYGTQLHFSSSYHPQTDGQTEVTNRTLGDILRKIVRDDQQWDLHLAHAEIAYNHAVSPATGMSPYYCDLGYHSRVPVDFLRPSQMHPDTSCPALDDWVAHMTSIMKTAHEHIAASRTRMAARANRSRMDHPFKVGDDVLIDARHLQLKADTRHKFRHHFFAPCGILQTVGSDTASSPVSFRVKLPYYLRPARVHDVYHVSLLRPYRKPSERFAERPYERPPPIMVDGHEEFLVSDIIGRRVTDDNPPHVEYLVCWKGYPDEEATWEALEHLQHARMLVCAYDRARRAGFTAPPQPTDPPPPAEEIDEVEPAPSEADLQQQPDASERPQRTRRHPARYDD